MLLFHIETYYTFYKEVQDIVESRDVIRSKDKNNITFRQDYNLFSAFSSIMFHHA
jgi:hypothetical protein